MKISRRWVLGAVALAVAAAAVLAWSYRDTLTLDAIEAWIRGFGVWAPVGYVVVYALATVAMIPGGPFDALGGALFGPVLGTAVNLTGASLGAALAFLVARHIGADWVERRAGARMLDIKRGIESEGWRFVAFVRLVPIFPYNIFNYLLGLTRIPFWQYCVTTVLCMAPSTVAYTWMGYAGRHLASGGEDQIWYGLMFLGLVGVAIVLPRLITRWRRRAGPRKP